MNERDRLKAEYIDYRERAIEACKDTNVKVSHGAAVQAVGDGAFVEAMVWVPKLVIPEPEPEVKF